MLSSALSFRTVTGARAAATKYCSTIPGMPAANTQPGAGLPKADQLTARL